MRRCPARARPEVSAPRSPRSGRSWSRGAELVLDEVGFDPRGFDLVATGEGVVDRTTGEGKAPGEVARRCVAAGVRCVVFGGRVTAAVEGAETWELSGDPARAAADLTKLGETLARSLVA
jgi:hypothetical protein